MLECNRDEQWVDRKEITYLKENHSRFEEILKEQNVLAEKYPVIVPFLNEEESMEVTAEEHKAIIEYLTLREKAEFLIREYHYYLGQAMHIPGLQKFGIHRSGEQETEERRTSQLLELLAENQIEEADQMFRFSNPEYRTRVEMESEAQKAVSILRKSEKVKNAIDRYVDAVNGRWLLFMKLFYQYAVDDILNSSKKSME